nr:hypothetical protein [Candidatus Freyarchaeota archaeon]
MSKKAKEVVEEEPKFKQPWLGFLAFFTVLGAAYISFQWFLHPVWGLATKLVTANAFVMATIFTYGLGMGATGGSLGILLSLNNPMYIAMYPLGYLVDWVPYMVFCIVWVFTIAFLALWVPVSPLKRQPWAGIGILAATLILAFITWYILGIVLGWKGYEMILLGTCGFLVFPVWVTLLNYWPFATPERMGMHPAIKGAVYGIISWVLAFVLYGIFNTLIWSNPIATAFTQYTMGNVLMPQMPFEPYDFWVSLLLCIIVGSTITSIVNPWTEITQPKRGLLLLVVAVILGVVMWYIISAILGPSSQTVLITEPVPWLFTFPTTNHGNVSAYMAFPLVTLLAGQMSFQMWPWSRWGVKGNIGLVITSFIIGTILYYLFMVNPGFAVPLLGGNLVTPMSGLETLYLSLWGAFMQTGVSAFAWEFVVYMLYFEGTAEFIGHALMFAWVLTVVIFGLLAYEAFDHWPWK